MPKSSRALLLGSTVLLLLNIFGGWSFAGMELAGVHSARSSHIEPLSEDPHALKSGLDSTTSIVRFVPDAIGISSKHAQQSIVLSAFSLVAGQILCSDPFCTSRGYPGISFFWENCCHQKNQLKEKED